MVCHYHAFLLRLFSRNSLSTVAISVHLSCLNVDFEAEKIRGGQQDLLTVWFLTRLFFALNQVLAETFWVPHLRNGIKLTVRLKVCGKRGHTILTVGDFLNQMLSPEVFLAVYVVAVWINNPHNIFNLIFDPFLLKLSYQDCARVEAKVGLCKYFEIFCNVVFYAEIDNELVQNSFWMVNKVVAHHESIDCFSEVGFASRWAV